MTIEDGGVLHVQVLTPKGVIWEGGARSVSSVNSQGPFDLLPEHAHFISLIERQPIIVTQGNGEDRTFLYETAVIRLFDGIVTIYAEIA